MLALPTWLVAEDSRAVGYTVRINGKECIGRLSTQDDNKWLATLQGQECMGITQGDGYYGQSNCGECHAFPIPRF